MSISFTTIPSSDELFRRAAQSAFGAGAKTPTALAQELREKFPLVRVIESEIEGYRERWYVYREGRWVP